ncbi:hypothetical protein DESPIG_02626 [Desulfovibrio piger ATCC 29098]|uniref:Uncharacterized protein n=1 Tax=Desulfovibrio piger ATCC 29098 TaxID=411464 RepID=B6WX03_9BACT|nr:hypothetical protein DESPIG_02626 [Desulfovibrio piger ATCC 29098]
MSCLWHKQGCGGALAYLPVPSSPHTKKGPAVYVPQGLCRYREKAT